MKRCLLGLALVGVAFGYTSTLHTPTIKLAVGRSTSNVKFREATSRPVSKHYATVPDGLLETEDSTILVRTTTPEAFAIWSFPALTAILSFNLYEEISDAFHDFVDFASNKSWAPVDGGKLVTQMLIPIINGPVLTTVSILFATLVATTISTLYQRQINLHKSLAKEVDELRRLGGLLDSFPEPYRQEAKDSLDRYVQNLFQLVAERNVTVESRLALGVGDIFLLLNKLANDCQKDPSIISDTVLGYAYDSLIRVEDEQTNFVSIYQSAFPVMHYVNLSLLAFGICLVFLIESDEDVMFFLVGFQLKFLWTILNSVFATMAAICFDLNSPFSGSYSIVFSTTDQVDAMRKYLAKPFVGSDG